MGFYDRHILPRLLNAAMSTKPITYQRRKVVPRAQGRVLEVGFGAGHNLPFYDPAKVELSGRWSPRPRCGRAPANGPRSRPSRSNFLACRASKFRSTPTRRHRADHLYDVHIPDVMKALGEMRRVMKPDGRMIFCEHGSAPDRTSRAGSSASRRSGSRYRGGCHVGQADSETDRRRGLHA